MIDQNKNDPATMWKTLKEVIRGESLETKNYWKYRLRDR